VAIDLYGFILVNESGNNYVSVFDKDNVFIHCFVSSDSGAGQFSTLGMACSPNGNICVLDQSSNRIHIFFLLTITAVLIATTFYAIHACYFLFYTFCYVMRKFVSKMHYLQN